MTEHVDGRFTGGAGGRIYWQAWLPAGAVRGVVALAHGIAEHGGRYAHVGARLAEAGYATYALDHHGHGRSDGVRGNVNRMAEVTGDLDRLISLAVERHPDVPVFLLGHSLGGLIALDYVVTRGTARLRGLLLSGAAVDPSVGSPVEKLLAKLLSSVAPNLGLLALDATAVSRDPKVVADYEADPLNYHGKIRARTGAESLAAVDRVTAALSTIDIPILVMHGTEDKLTAPSGSKLVADQVSSPDITLKLYDGLYHEIFNEPEQDAVLTDVVTWLDAHA